MQQILRECALHMRDGSKPAGGGNCPTVANARALDVGLHAIGDGVTEIKVCHAGNFASRTTIRTCELG